MAISSSQIFFFSTLLLLSSSSMAADSKVSVELYYETLCPYSAYFIVNYLAKIFKNGVISIVDLDLIPYGNAYVAANGTVICQHGEDECALNIMQACAMNVWPDINVHFALINCMETVVMNETRQDLASKIGKCFSIEETKKLDPTPVIHCSANGTGYELHLKNGKRTDKLNPPHKWVPWVLINKKPLEDYTEFQDAVCDAYKGKNRPKACDDCEDILNTSKEEKLRNGGAVSYGSKITLPDAMKTEIVDQF